MPPDPPRKCVLCTHLLGGHVGMAKLIYNVARLFCRQVNMHHTLYFIVCNQAHLTAVDFCHCFTFHVKLHYEQVLT